MNKNEKEFQSLLNISPHGKEFSVYIFFSPSVPDE